MVVAAAVVADAMMDLLGQHRQRHCCCGRALGVVLPDAEKEMNIEVKECITSIVYESVRKWTTTSYDDMGNGDIQT